MAARQLSAKKPKHLGYTLRTLLSYMGRHKLLLLAVDLWSVFRGSPRQAFFSLPRPVRWVLALALLLAVLIFGVYGTGYDPQDFIYFKF